MVRWREAASAGRGRQDAREAALRSARSHDPANLGDDSGGLTAVGPRRLVEPERQ